jgi:hypothetical protein
MHIRGARALIEEMPDSVRPQLKNLVEKIEIQTTWLCVQASAAVQQNGFADSLPDMSMLPLRSTESVLLSRQYQKILDDDFRAVIEQVANFATLFDQQLEVSTRVESHQASFKRFCSLSAQVDSKLSTASPSTPQGEVILLAIKIWKAYVLQNVNYTFRAHDLARDLMQLLELYPSSIWDDHTDGLIWICMIGSMAAAHVHLLGPVSDCGLVEGTKVDGYFVRRMLTIRPRGDAFPVDIFTERGLLTLSMRFLHLDVVQRRLLHLLAAKIKRTAAA